MAIKIILALVGAAAIGIAGYWYLSGSERPKDAKSTTSIYDFAFTSIEGAPVPLSRFRGQYLLLVNVASECGFTPQYAELQQLSDRFAGKLVVIGFPANDFMGQEPGTDEEIKTFCTARYGVTFPLSTKVSVVGEEQSDIYRWLSDKRLNGWNDSAPRWNFAKYLITPDGELAKMFPSAVTPLSNEIAGAIR